MSEQQLREFGERAVALVALPDLEELEHRGTRLRRRRQAIAATGAAAVVAAVAWASVNVSQPKADQDPAQKQDPLANAESYYGFDSRPELEAGSYTWRVSSYLDRDRAVVTLPAGWHAWRLGPNRWLDADTEHQTGYVGLIVTEVSNVVEEPCRGGSDGMNEVGTDPQELVHALATMPGHRLLLTPRPDDRFGYPGTHLRLVARHVECPGDQGFDLTTDTGIGETIFSSGRGSRVDIWVIDVGERRPVTVWATVDQGSPGWLKDQLDQVVATVRLVPPPRVGE
jgi:hypothetical protein